MRTGPVVSAWNQWVKVQGGKEVANLGEGAVREQVGYMVDMAKADALELLGDTRQAWELVHRHV